MKFILSLLFIGVAFGSDAQILKKLRNATGLLNNPTKFLKDQGISALKKSKARMDSSSFGFAISFSDNAGLFENKETMNDVRDGFLILFNDEESDEDIANEYKDVGEMAFAANEYRFAEVSFIASRLVFETSYMTNHVNYPGVIADLGLLNHTMGRYASAEKYTEEALNIRKDLFGEESMAYVASLNNMAVLYKDQGKYTDAEKTMDRAVDLAKELGKDEELLFAIMLNNQAMLFQKLGRTSEAESLLNQSIDLSEKIQGEKSSNHQRLVTNLAVLYQEMEKYEEAELLFLRVIELKEKRFGKRHPDYAHMLNNLASLYVLMEKDAEVEDLLERARDIYIRKFGNSHPSVATNASHLGNFYRYKNRLDEAKPLLIDALQIRETALGNSHPDVVQSKEDLALLYWQSGNWPESNDYFQASLDQSLEFIENFFPAMSEEEKSSYWSKIQPRFFRYFSFASQASEKLPGVSAEMFNYRLATKSLLMSSSQKIRNSILTSGDEMLVGEYLQWIDIKESLATYYSFSKEEIISQKVNLDSLEQLANKKEKYLSVNSNAFNEGFLPKPKTFVEIKSSLSPNEAMVEILQIPVYARTFTGVLDYFALVVNTEDNPELVRLGDSKELDDKFFKYYKNAIRLKLDDKFSYEKFWLPLEPAISNSNHLYISKDGVYNQINLNTLKNDAGFVFDRWNIELITTANDLADVKARKEEALDKPVILFGFPDYGSSNTILPLPGTKKEVETINSILKAAGIVTQLKTGEKATETAVKNAEPHSIYHFATHGFFLSDVNNLPKERVFGIQPEIAQEQPMLRSGLLLAGAGQTYEGLNHKEYSASDNGVLTAYEAMNLPLEDTELVVLSACETGLGDIKAGEGVYGLQRAFLVAGTKRIIMSLWKVDDEATQYLMSEFYKNLSENSDVRAAFKKAQTKLKQSHPEPYYWGAFVLIES